MRREAFTRSGSIPTNRPSRLRRLAAAGLAALLMSALSAPATAAPPTPPAVMNPEVPALVPEPVSMVARDQRPYQLGHSTTVVATGEAAAAGNLLVAQLRPATGFVLPVSGRAKGPHPIEVVVADGLGPVGHEAEGYRLQVSSRSVRLTAGTAAGAINGVQTLLQLFGPWSASPTPVSRAWSAPAVDVVDHPRYGYRGFGLDVTRSFLGVDEVKRVIDQGSRVKLNVLHLHLSDDQGWRIAVDQPRTNPSGIDYSLLTSVSGGTAMTYNTDGELMGTELGRPGYYSKGDYREIVEYAAARNVTVVPELDMPGHVNAALHAIGQLNSAGSAPKPAAGQDTPPANGTPDVGYSTFDVGNPATYEFAQHVLNELAELSPGPYLHMGGDEAHSTPHEEYVSMVSQIAARGAATGKKVMGWNEYAAADLPRGSVVQYWNGDPAEVAANVLRNDAEVVLSPVGRAYVPQREDAAQPYGGTWACGGPCDLKAWYDWDPGTFMPGVTGDRVLGVEAVHWGEWLRGIDQIDQLTWPRTLATAEVGWSPQTSRSYEEFTTRVGSYGATMTIAGMNPFPSRTVDWRLAATAATNRATSGPGTVDVDVQVASVDAEGPGQVEAAVVLKDGSRHPVRLTSSRTISLKHLRGSAPLTGTVEVPARAAAGARLVVEHHDETVEVPVRR